MSDAQHLPARMQERIFDAVLAELAEVGIDEFTLDGVARRAEIDPEFLHARWADRRVLLMEAMIVRAGQLAPVPDTGSLSTDLGEVSASLMKLSGTEMGRQWFHRLLPGGRDADLTEVGSDFWAVRMGAVQSIFQHAANRGELRAGVDTRDATRMLAAALYCDVIFNDIPIRQEYAAQVREIFLYGTLAPNIHDDSLIDDFENREHIRALLTATIDAMIDPVALVEAVRDDDGQITDFTFQEANPAACLYLQRRYDELIGASMTATLPDIESSGMFARYIDCLQTGQPVIVEDFPYFSQRYQKIRRYDLRGARAGRDWLSMTWRDVTDRSEAVAAIESARNLLRISSDALLDPQVLLEVIQDDASQSQDLIFRDANLAFCDYLGQERSEVLGRRLTEVFPAVVDVGVLAQYLHSASSGVPVVADDFAYFNEVLGELRYYDIRGRQVQPGLLSLTFRDVTERVEANRILEETRREQAAADALYRRSMESAAVGMCLASPEGPLFRVNDAMCAFFGYDAETLLTKTWIELTAPEYRDADLASVADMVAGRIESYQMEKQFIHADGHRIWGHLSVGCLRNPDGSVAMSIGQIVDITAEVDNREQLRAALGSLAASEERYRLMTQNATDAITHIRDAKFVWVSAAIQNVLGAPPEHWVGRDISEVVPPEDTADYLERLAILEAGGSVHKRFRVRAVDGVTHWVETNSSPFFDSQGRRDGFTGTLRVVDDQVAAEAELAEARRRSEAADQLLRRSVDNAAVGICLTEPEGRFVDVNDALCAFFGYDVTSLKQKTWQDLTAPEYLQADLDSVEAMLAGGLDSYRTLKQYVHADGSRVWGDLSVSCVRDAQGRVEQFIAQIIDVTKAVESTHATSI